MPYLTPDSIPETDDCRSLLIPASSDWLAIVSGALTELVKPYNWQQFGAVTVEEAVERMQDMIDLYYEGCASSCDVGEGLPPFRINSDGHIEQLVDGVWVEPEGDYTIPPVPDRDEPTAEERRCLAAANAARVLELLYENVTDSFNEDRTLEEAVAALLAAIAATFFWLAPIAAGLLLLALAAMETIYLLVEFFGADLWTTEFTDALKCILFGCSVDTAGVVTFDYNCVMEGLNTTLSHPDLDVAQLRLLVQLGYLLGVIGGVDALNHAGATTSIETADCDDCDVEWCFEFDFTLSDGGWSPDTPLGLDANYTPSVGWTQATFGGSTGTYIYISVDPTLFTHAYFEYEAAGNGTSSTFSLSLAGSIDLYDSTAVVLNTPYAHVWNGEVTGDRVMLQVGNSNTGGGGTSKITLARFHGRGECPFGEPNCVP